MLNHALLVLLLPLASAAIIALFLRRAGTLAATVSVLTAAAIAFIAVGPLALHGDRFESSMEWLRFGRFAIFLGIKYDDLAALMLCIVGIVGLCVHVFSLGYLHDDAAKARYFGGLSIFMFSMIGITLADNLFMMFIFWELVGFSSWLLIGHWYHKKSASDAAKKAFIVNRVGDFGFLLGIVLCYWFNGSVRFSDLHDQHGVSRLIPLLLFCGAVGKSAQMPLQVWLPDAMEGPTPVSALIHAATMVAAGIYMLCRIDPIMVPFARDTIMWIGTATALYAALCAIVQRDIKRVLAYSTLSQLGYMVAAFGLGNLQSSDPSGPLATGVAAAMFHLTTHAFFKALLFLGSGSVIYACHHEQDIFQMGGLRKKLPITFATFTIAVAAIVGLPYLAGFFSKDAILYLAYSNNKAVFALLAFTAILTSFYMVRLWKLVFLGEPRSEHASHAHEGGWVLTLPLIVLAALSVVGGYAHGYPKVFADVLDAIPEGEGSAHKLIFLVSLGVLAIGVSLGLTFYKSATTDTLAEKSPALFSALGALRNLFDAIYDFYVAKIQQPFALFLNVLEQVLLAGAVIRGLSYLTGAIGLGARALHVGRLNAYLYWFLGGVVVLWLFAAGVF